MTAWRHDNPFRWSKKDVETTPCIGDCLINRSPFCPDPNRNVSTMAASTAAESRRGRKLSFQSRQTAPEYFRASGCAGWLRLRQRRDESAYRSRDDRLAVECILRPRNSREFNFR